MGRRPPVTGTPRGGRRPAREPAWPTPKRPPTGTRPAPAGRSTPRGTPPSRGRYAGSDPPAWDQTRADRALPPGGRQRGRAYRPSARPAPPVHGETPPLDLRPVQRWSPDRIRWLPPDARCPPSPSPAHRTAAAGPHRGRPPAVFPLVLEESPDLREDLPGHQVGVEHGQVAVHVPELEEQHQVPHV